MAARAVFRFALLTGAVFAGNVTAQLDKGAASSESEKDDVTVTGVVVDLFGRPLRDAGIVIGQAHELMTRQTRIAHAARTDESGRFEFRIPPIRRDTNVYSVRYALIACRGFSTVRVALINPYNPYGKASTREVELGRIKLLPGGSLRGIIRGVGGRPVKDARIVGRDLLASGHYARFNSQGQQRPVYLSATTTDARGRFELEGVFRGGIALEVSAPGYYERTVPFVSAAHAIDVSLTRSGFAEGRILDENDKPVDAIVYSQYESLAYSYRDPQRFQRTDEDGRFKISLSHRGRYAFRAVAVNQPNGVYISAQSDSFDEPRSDVQIELAKPAVENKPITVEIVEKGSGRPIVEARAVAVWQDPKYLNAVGLAANMRSMSVAADDQGKVELPGPRGNQPHMGGVMVKARGYAPKLYKKLEYDAEKPPKIKLELDAESAVRGVVVDVKTGKPLAGARVTVAPPGMADKLALSMYGYYAGNTAAEETAETDAQGRFRVGCLGAGKFEVYATVRGRPQSKSVHLKLGTAEHKDSVRLEIPVGVALTGKVYDGTDGEGRMKVPELGPRWRVRLGSTQNSGYYGIDSFWEGGFRMGFPQSAGDSLGVEIGPGGEFEFLGLSPGRSRFYLVAPPIGKRGSSLSLSVEPLRIRRKDMRRDIDISEDVPGIVRGKVRVIGVPMPMGRLLVSSVAVLPGQTRPARVSYNPTFFRCVPEEDGSFAFRVGPGRHHIYIMDAAASTVLFRAKAPVEVESGKTQDVTFDVPLTRVRVRLRPQEKGQPFVVGRMEWLVSHPGDGVFHNFGQYDRGFGRTIQGERELLLFLPPTRVQFAVRSYPSMVDPVGQHSNLQTGAAEITAVAGELMTVDIAVQPRVDLTNAAPPKDSPDSAAKSKEKKRQ